MSDTPPDHVCNNPKSRFYDEAVLERGIGILFNGKERTNVDEYCVSEGWIRVSVGKSRDRFGYPVTTKVLGSVAPYFRDLAQASSETAETADATQASSAPATKTPAETDTDEAAAKAVAEAAAEARAEVRGDS